MWRMDALPNSTEITSASARRQKVLPRPALDFVDLRDAEDSYAQMK